MVSPLAAKLMSLLLVTKILIVLFVIILGVAYMIRVQTFPESFTHPFEVSLPGHKTELILDQPLSVQCGMGL